jgi:CRISPR-associated protein Cmr3
MMRVFIEPTDVWLFRDGRSFRAGEDHWARSLFPPTSNTIQGVIRSKVLFDSGVDLTAYANGAPEAQVLIEQIGGPGVSDGTLRIRGPFLGRWESGKVVRYYPLPVDLVQEKKSGLYHGLTPLKGASFRANWPDNVPLVPLWAELDEYEEARGWVREDALRAYLTEGVPPSAKVVLPDRYFYTGEPRFGIRMERTAHRPDDGYLFEVEYVRVQEGAGLDVEVEGIPRWEPKQGVLGIGGEARAGYYQVLDEPALAFPFPQSLGPRFKVYFATPAYFRQGWHPADWGTWFQGDVRLVAAAIDRARRIGGWDIVRNEHKPIHAYVPAGSVYFFKSEGQVIYSQEPVTEEGGEIGYGQVFLGTWEYIEWEG